MTADTPLPLPAGLRERVLDASRRARPPGRALPETPDISPVEVFERAADAFAGALSALDDAHWRRPVLRDLDVQGLVGHLIGVEDDVRRALAGDPAVAAADHVASTQPTAVGQSGRAPASTRRDWRRSADRTLALLRDADPDGPVALHGLHLPLGALLVVRAFELWTHENDVRAAVGLPGSVPDPSALRRMSDLAVRLLPVGVARVGTGTSVPVDLHLVLTGPGGGTWDVTFGRPADQGSGGGEGVTIVADTVGFCRLAANRIRPDQLAPFVSGAVAHADRILAGAAALALD
ncbi:maleylpyruvate isomerase family mycothiol-dependent enzyme [Geodermatophilus sp. YIM 151500]|uniref:maleylpyruvate isomerase family mycothiol-dependent enzyme n=1 Tax=Geodermatophilus sp. YIM 151500 TaxID=2984531 RepID=UPI0021E4E52A|nr:maleylpyruvate isomerase family mycothiol-dependent enzyme [Geodermatophilus sp. YIM 151500]MCV2490782.1 maleylpyruvate isomerase family mycothiol-dependent enzyme [Geodermatophilus sp. YIM 151500]